MPTQVFEMTWMDSANSALLSLLALVLLLYLARGPAHRFILSISHGLHSLLRLSACAVIRAAHYLAGRNREVLLATAQDLQERALEREFQRVHAIVSRDLSAYPALHRALNDQIARIDQDYSQSATVPPQPPAWLDAVGAVAQIPAQGDPAVAKILEDINHTLETSSHNALLEYRAASRRRHVALKRIKPYWRRLNGTLENVDSTVKELDARGRNIDTQMERYQEIRRGDDRVVQSLSASAAARFLTSGLLLTIAAFAAVMNFHLLATPMGALMSGGVSAGALPAAFMTLLQVSMGVVILETLRVTRLFPSLGQLDQPLRVRLLTMAAFILLSSMALEAGLVFSFERSHALMLAEQAGATDMAPAWITSMAQLLLGSILPLALALIAIPLESFVGAARSVLGHAALILLRSLALTLRLIGHAVRAVGDILVRTYDMIIFLPLWVEERLRGSRPAAAAAPAIAAEPEAVAPPAEPEPPAKEPAARKKVKQEVGA